MMRRELLQATGLLLFAPPGRAGVAPGSPSPEVPMDERIAYTPDAADIQVSMPDCVTLFDHTRPGSVPGHASTGSEGVRRFYFRALKTAERAEIRFGAPGSEMVVSLQIWSFDDL